MAQYYNLVDYGLTNALQQLPPAPVLARRAPTTRDTGYALGQLWIYMNATATSSTAYIIVANVAGAATWLLLEVAGGAGSFTTLTSTDAFTLDTTVAAANTLGNTTGATSIAMSVGTGGFTLDGVGASTYAVGASTTTGTITIGGTAQTGTLTLGSSSGVNIVAIGAGSGATDLQLVNAQTAGSVEVGSAMTTGTITVGGTGLQTGTISIAPGTGAQSLLLGTGGTGAKTITVGGTAANVITIGNAQTAGSVSIGAAMTTGTIAIGGTGLQTGTITVGGGTGAQTVNLATGATGVKTVHIADSAVANVVTLGSTTGAASTTIQGGSVGIALNAAGAVKMAPATVSAAAYAATLNSQVGYVTLTGQTLASAGVQTLVITNSLATTTTPILVSVDNAGANDAQLTITRVQMGAGSINVTVKNNGAASLNGDIHITYWMLS